ncbi:MAG: NAD-dependent epimerase/dehydratase family protein, partial [Candidatus Omnitrophica bacterium]|nr:NAD-dependent epimerase/dehydratase family protein [Candidatus Omnitrophota bacterium]
RIVLIGGVPFPAINIIYSLLEKNSSDQVLVLNDNLDNFPFELKENPRVTLWQGTAQDRILIKNLLSNAQVLINMSAADNLACITETDKIENYILSLSNIFEFGKKSNLQRIIHISSSRVYGNRADSPVTEEHSAKPTDLKGLMDSLGENLMYYYSRKYSFPIVILRTFNIYGPSQSLENTVPSLITSALANQPLQLWEDGEQTENLLFVEDFIEALQKILKEKFDSLKGEIINIGNLGVIPVKEIASIILSKLNKPQSLITYDKNNKRDFFELTASIMKAKILLSWSPKTEIEEGLEKTVDWYIKNRDWWDTEPQKTENR